MRLSMCQGDQAPRPDTLQAYRFLPKECPTLPLPGSAASVTSALACRSDPGAPPHTQMLFLTIPNLEDTVSRREYFESIAPVVETAIPDLLHWGLCRLGGAGTPGVPLGVNLMRIGSESALEAYLCTEASSYGVYKVKVVNEFPHDPEAYLRGFFYAENDTLFESTGLYGRSSVRKVALLNGKVEALHEMQSSVFGEGLTLLGERLFQLTWLQDTGFIYDRYNFSKFKSFIHHMQDGWGLATDGEITFWK
ncbi:hypothetical protein HAX54_008474 [Datura stramonium]|uniref:Uncharacterized protein n=1 Tax=Datura stramonium TaxID=4076 RepID=A0ABS8TG00_DATST|nr:hypothetical protein [Datura stramonium]